MWLSLFISDRKKEQADNTLLKMHYYCFKLRLPQGMRCFQVLDLQHIHRMNSVGTGGVWIVQIPPPEMPKALQNHTKLNPIVKTVKNCQIWDANTQRCLEKRQ